MSEYNTSNASGQMAGYLFQPERALYWLAKSKRGGIVGIETGDDVVQIEKSGERVMEQDKHSTSAGNPFTDRGKNLWNTINIWLRSIENEEVDLEMTNFLLVTNKVVPDCLATRISKAKSTKEIKKCVAEFRNIGSDPTEGIKVLCDEVLAYKDSQLEKLFEKIYLYDGRDGTYGEELTEKIKGLLHIPDDAPGEEIIHELLGWIYERILYLWRNGEAAWITKLEFDKKFFQTRTDHRNKLFYEKLKSLIEVTDFERKENMERLFVRQLTELDLKEEDELLISAIDDFIIASSERTNFSKEGFLTQSNFINFEERLIERWNNIFHSSKKAYEARKKRLLKTMPQLVELPEEIGLDILQEVLNHREPLAGQPTEQFYLTRGTYHKLADDENLILGWHPDYDIIFTKERKE